MPYRTVVLVGAAAFFVCCLVWSGFNGQRVFGSNPVLACDQGIYDFGARPTGESFAHVFVLRNRGDRDLEIVKVRPGCSCAKAELSEKVIKAGRSVPLKVTVSLENLRGPVEQHIVVESKDPAQRFLLLRTKGLVESAFDVKPHAIDFGKVVQGQELEGCVDIGGTGPGSFRLVAVACDSPLCRIRQETVEEGRGYRISVRTTGKLPPGFWKTELKIRTDHPKESQIVVPVVARVEAGAATPKGE
jgi:Protein of unknown function (DUF1573)